MTAARPETGEKTVVAYCPNPDAGKAEHERTTSWRPGPDQMPMPGGRAPWFRTRPAD